MPEYQLTEGQKNILRAASRGLREETVRDTWTWHEMQSDDDAFELSFEITDGFPDAATHRVRRADLREFEEQGFLKSIDGRNAYHVKEQKIHDAVDNDFHLPAQTVPSTNFQTNIHGNVIGSNINIAQYMDNITQTVQHSEFLSPEAKAEILVKISALHEELKDFEESHSREIREVTRSLNILVDDLVDDEPDRQNLTGAVARLKRAGTNLRFAPAALTRIGEIIDWVKSIFPDLGSANLASGRTYSRAGY